MTKIVYNEEKPMLGGIVKSKLGGLVICHYSMFKIYGRGIDEEKYYVFVCYGSLIGKVIIKNINKSQPRSTWGWWTESIIDKLERNTDMENKINNLMKKAMKKELLTHYYIHNERELDQLMRDELKKNYKGYIRYCKSTTFNDMELIKSEHDAINLAIKNEYKVFRMLLFS